MTSDLLINPPKLPRPATAAKLAAGLARHPRATTRRAAGATKELAKIAAGRSDVKPAKRDRRFADPGWEGNFLLRRVLQTYLTIGGTGRRPDRRRPARLARRAPGAVRRHQRPRRPRPEQLPASNPAVLKATIDEGGANLRARRAPLRRRLPGPALDGRHERVRRRREPRAHARHRDQADRRLRADRVRAADRDRARGPAAVRPADDQQVLRARPGARAAAWSSTSSARASACS